MVDLKVINGRIRKIGNGEKTLRTELGVLSRELLQYVPETGDIDAVNRLLGVLTPKTKELTQKYFAHFLSHKWEAKEGRFGKKSTNKDIVLKRVKLSAEFLKDEANNVFTWTREKTEKAKPKKDYAAKLAKLVQEAISDENEGLDVSGVVAAMIAGGAGITAIFNSIGAVVKEQSELIKKGDTATRIPSPKQEAAPKQEEMKNAA